MTTVPDRITKVVRNLITLRVILETDEITFRFCKGENERYYIFINVERGYTSIEEMEGRSKTIESCFKCEFPDSGEISNISSKTFKRDEMCVIWFQCYIKAD